MKLSKSKYIKGITCPKQLWMQKYMPEMEKRNPTLQAIFDKGNEVGDLARKYFGEYELVDFDKGISSMLEETQNFINSGANIIAEASFSVDDLFCSVDILRKNGDGWDIIEVKCSTETHDIYIDDMSFQMYVLKKAGINVKRVFNMHLNKEYYRYGELDLQKLFIINEYTQACIVKQNEVAENIKKINQFMDKAADIEPAMALDLYCEKPYECFFMDYCRKDLPKPNILDISRLDKKKKYEYLQNGIITFDDIVKRTPKLSDKQWLQVDTEYYGRKPYIDKINIKSCIAQYHYPIYYLDFETYQPAVPPFDATKPYSQIAFQYSLHIQYEKGGELEHREFLGVAGEDPRRALCEQLCNDIPMNACTLVYNQTFEKTRIKEMALVFPDLAEHLMNIYDNIQDLMIPFSSKYYYSKELKGSYSIKYVLPALCPNDPELDYHSLDGIHNGSEAMNAFPDLPNHTPEEQAIIRKNLLAYCCLDTLAMVKVLEKLYSMC